MDLRKTARRRLKEFVEGLGGIRILRELPGGVDVGADLRRWLPGFDVRMVFDVGANRGQSTRAFLEAFPTAQVHSFEPSPEWFRLIEEETRGIARVSCHAVALGAEQRMQSFRVSELVGDADKTGGSDSTETVQVTTLDAFCAHHRIERVGFLKIDTEGHDLEVLRGAQNMLSEQRIDLVQVEAGMNPRNTRHVPFADFESFLARYDYLLFGFYDQQHEWSGEPQLRRADAVFVSPRVWRTERWR